MATPAQIRAVRKFEKEHTKRILLTLNRRTDADVIEYLEQQQSMQGEIKRLIRKEIKDKERP